jgi:hypothetical protein
VNIGPEEGADGRRSVFFLVLFAKGRRFFLAAGAGGDGRVGQVVLSFLASDLLLFALRIERSYAKNILLIPFTQYVHVYD